jgi:hypothetical protein
MGSRKGLFELMRDPDLEEDFPGLIDSEYEVKSETDPQYNCVSFAVGDLTHFWYDDKHANGYYWPPGTPSADTMDGWLKVFSDHGYRETNDVSFEQEFEKVAIYSRTELPRKIERPQHVARQKASGRWVSKMGPGKDIEHSTLAPLEGKLYGRVVKIMKRKCKDGRRVLE